MATAIVISGFTVVSVFCAITVRMFIKRPKVAAVVAAIISSAILQFGITIYVGYVDPFLPFAFGGGVIIAWIIATISIFFFDKLTGRTA